MRTNARAIHGSRFLVYALVAGAVAAAALWATIARGADLAGPVKMDLDDTPSCARFRQAGAAVAGVAPCSVGLGRLVLKCDGDPDCSKATSAKVWTYRPAKWLQARWKATPTPSPSASVPMLAEIDACPGSCMVYDLKTRKATCRRLCPK